MDDIVTDPAVLKRLPAGPLRTTVRFHRFWFADLLSAALGKLYPSVPSRRAQVLLVLRPISSRIANARIHFIGPFEITRPAPWLAGPARQLHPEAFTTTKD